MKVGLGQGNIPFSFQVWDNPHKRDKWDKSLLKVVFAQTNKHTLRATAYVPITLVFQAIKNQESRDMTVGWPKPSWRWRSWGGVEIQASLETLQSVL